MQPTTRRLLSLATTVVVMGVTGLQAGMPPAVADIGAALRYVCTTSTGMHEINVRIGAFAPPAAVVGRPVQLGTTEVTVELPAELVGETSGARPAETPAGDVPPVGVQDQAVGFARLDVTVEQGGRSREAGWPDFALAVDERRDGTVLMTGHGVTPPVEPRAKGVPIRWLAGHLTLSLSGAGGERTSVSCSLKKTAELGRVEVRGNRTTASPGVPGSTPSPAAAEEPREPCPEIPPPGTDPNYAINETDPGLKKILDDPAIPSGMDRVPTSGYVDGLPFCITATGFANVEKLGNAVPVSVETQLRRGVYSYRPTNTLSGTNRTEQFGYVLSDAQPISATVLAFGFMPTRATSQAIQVRPPKGLEGEPKTGNLRLSGLFNVNRPPNAGETSELFARAYIQLRAGDASVNGVPLKLGDDCKSETTLFDAYSYMGDPNMGFVNATDGQTLQVRDLNIPAFSGCGVGEDLSPLLTASISGGANYGRLDAGRWCNPRDGVNCDESGHGPNPDTWTIEPGGDITATASDFSVTGGDSSVSCTQAIAKFHLDAQHWRGIFGLARVEHVYRGCRLHMADGTTVPIDLKQDGESWLRGTSMTSDGLANLRFDGILLDAQVKTDELDCSLRLGSVWNFSLDPPPREVPTNMSGAYSSQTGKLTVPPAQIIVTPSTTCDIPGFTKGRGVNRSGVTFELDPKQRITQP